MTRLLSIDPGLNTGVALGEYGDNQPYTLLERWQIHGGVEAFGRWVRKEAPAFDELVCEQFRLDLENDFSADLTPVKIEGAIVALWPSVEVRWQSREDKGGLIGYPAESVTKAQRQRIRFDFLKEHGLFAPGTDNDDSNDAICHSLVFLKRQPHLPTLRHYWPRRR